MYIVSPFLNLRNLRNLQNLCTIHIYMYECIFDIYSKQIISSRMANYLIIWKIRLLIRLVYYVVHEQNLSFL